MSRRSILVVDDNQDGREMVAEYLRFRGFEAIEVEGGAEAVEKALALRPRIILMDLAMPTIDGWEATRRLKSDPRTRDTIVIALTAHALAPDEAKAREAGCDGYVSKPCNLASLADLLERTLKRGRRALKATT